MKIRQKLTEIWHVKDINFNIYIFDMQYLSQFLSDFQKLRTVIIREVRSLIWIPIIMISKISLIEITWNLPLFSYQLLKTLGGCATSKPQLISKKKLQGYSYDCEEPFNHWFKGIWLDVGSFIFNLNTWLKHRSLTCRISVNFCPIFKNLVPL